MKECYKIVGYPNNMRGGARSDPKPFQRGEFIKCDHCGKPGHKVDACKIKLRDQNGAANNAASNAVEDHTQFYASQSLSYTATRHCFSANANAKFPLILDS